LSAKVPGRSGAVAKTAHSGLEAVRVLSYLFVYTHRCIYCSSLAVGHTLHYMTT
jgi:hypothetical protein